MPHRIATLQDYWVQSELFIIDPYRWFFIIIFPIINIHFIHLGDVQNLWYPLVNLHMENHHFCMGQSTLKSSCSFSQSSKSLHRCSFCWPFPGPFSAEPFPGPSDVTSRNCGTRRLMVSPAAMAGNHSRAVYNVNLGSMEYLPNGEKMLGKTWKKTSTNGIKWGFNMILLGIDHWMCWLIDVGKIVGIWNRLAE